MVTLTINALPVVTLAPFNAVCINSPAMDLIGGEPAGGLYFGTGVNSNGLIFDPQLAGPGTFTLSYVFVDTFGCTDTAYQAITVNALPTVTLDPIAAVCANTPSFLLSGGLPLGGSYSGNGVIGDTFDPAIAGVGTTTITYTSPIDTAGCQNTTSIDLVINGLPAVDLGSDVNSCANLTLTLDATNINTVSYSWLPGGQTTATIPVDSLGIGLGSKMFYVSVKNINNCFNQDSVKVLFHDCTGIEEQGSDVQINLYPNPSSGIVSVQSLGISNTMVSISIYTATDKLVFENQQVKVIGSLNKTLNLHHLANGFYLLKIQDDQKSWTKRFVIQK